MTKETQKNVAKETEQIAQSELLMELRLLMKDVFIGEICEEDDGISIRFLNGQKFRVEVMAA